MPLAYNLKSSNVRLDSATVTPDEALALGGPESGHWHSLRLLGFREDAGIHSVNFIWTRLA